MKTFKRTNWTTEEVIHILEGLRLVDRNGKETKELKTMNFSLIEAICQFEDFLRDPNEFGAMAFDTELKEIVHIGKIPPE